jgi:hypothetical protein
MRPLSWLPAQAGQAGPTLFASYASPHDTSAKSRNKMHIGYDFLTCSVQIIVRGSKRSRKEGLWPPCLTEYLQNPSRVVCWNRVDQFSERR